MLFVLEIVEENTVHMHFKETHLINTEAHVGCPFICKKIIYNIGKLVVLNSGFCILWGLVGLKNQGFCCTCSDLKIGTDEHMSSKEIGENSIMS